MLALSQPPSFMNYTTEAVFIVLSVPEPGFPVLYLSSDVARTIVNVSVCMLLCWRKGVMCTWVLLLLGYDGHLPKLIWSCGNRAAALFPKTQKSDSSNSVITSLLSPSVLDLFFSSLSLRGSWTMRISMLKSCTFILLSSHRKLFAIGLHNQSTSC